MMNGVANVLAPVVDAIVPDTTIAPAAATTTNGDAAAAPEADEKKEEEPKKRELPPHTPIVFPHVVVPPPVLPPPADALPLRTYLRGIQRPQDYKLDHIAAFGLHVFEDASLTDLMPDPSYLPKEEWRQPPSEDHPMYRPGEGPQLNNGRNAPGHKAYFDRCNELSYPNTVAFRTVRRLPSPPGEQSARLGNAYEFFKNLELMSGFWKDTTLEGPEPQMGDGDERPLHSRIHVRSGTGSQTPAEFRESLLASFVKLVTYDFGCNVQRPRVEPRLFIGPSTSATGEKFPHTSPGTSFPTNITFVYRTPLDRASARGGIIEGPIAALSARHTTVFDSTFEQTLDLCREVVGLLVTAQQRAREGKQEAIHEETDASKWWCYKPRWGGGSGGPIGKEEDRLPPGVSDEPSSVSIGKSLAEAAAQKNEERASRGPELGGREGLDAIRAALAAGGPLPSLSAGPTPPKRNVRGKGKTMSLYDNYRAVRPPSSSWDRKCRYTAIGKVPAAEYDDIFLVNCLNHHVCVSRARVAKSLILTIEGEQERVSEPLRVWRSRWWDLFVKEERIEAYTAVWGMMNWLMRVPQEGDRPDEAPFGDVGVYAEDSELHRSVQAAMAQAQTEAQTEARTETEGEAEGEEGGEKMEGVETQDGKEASS